MSRRKQSKPQQFGDNKNAPLSNETLSDAAGTIKQNLLPELDVQNVTSEQTNGLEAPFASSFRQSEVVATGEGASAYTTDEATVDFPEDEQRNEDFEVVRESVCRTRMASPGREEGVGDQQAVSADSTACRHGQFVPSHRNLLHPKYNGSLTAQKRQNGEAGGHNQEDTRKTIQGEERSKQEGILSSSVGEEREAGTEFPASEGTEEMYNCNSCENNFEQIGDYVHHKKFSCTTQSSETVMTYDGRTTEEQKDGDAENSGSTGNYVISGNVIMANQGDLTMDIDEERSLSPGKNGENTAVEDIDSERNMLPPDEAPIAEYADERVETPNSIPESENTSTKNDSPFVRDDKLERPGSSDVQQSEEVKESTDETDKLRKEIMATEAMAQAIQNMTTLASQTTSNNPEKPDIGAIRYQVRMIQQQQAYHVQMLNFLQWQLALASSSPQAAVAAAAAAASSRGSGMADGMSMPPGMQSPFLAGTGCLPGGALMPQMMAAMAMNNIHNSANESNGMAELAKARFMMGMQQASAESNQGIRSLFPSPIGDHEGLRRMDQEQRYQLKVADNDHDRAEINGVCTKGEEIKTEMELTRTKSDSGFDEDARSSSANGEAKEDDACSSHGSQEDGELRDSILKSTAEEHRHKCRFCSKIFGSDSALQIHIRSHTGERPFKCNICGNRFTTKGNLKVHFTRHKSKYPHIPMNSQPVPEYLDHVPTSNGVPYGMSILPEKAVLERPRLHGNPSIHLSPQQAAAIGQREAAPAQGFPNLFGHSVNGLGEKPENDFLRRPDIGIPNGIGPADVASAIQAQLLQRRRAEYLEAQNLRQEEMSDASENKNPMSILQAAMLPFLPSIAARQLDSVPPHLRYLLPPHLNQLNAQNGVSNDSNNNKMVLRLPTLQRSSSPIGTDGQNTSLQHNDKAAPNRQGTTGSSSETTKLQRLVENIDRGRALQKNECHMCHRILSCQSALKLHYRTHTGERPYKCDLCSRAFTTRGNLRTHYSSVHRQQMRPLPPGGQRSTQSESFSCTFCPARFRDPVEFQHHMQMHAMAQAQQQQRMLDIEREKNNASAEGLDMTNGNEKPQENGESRNNEVKREPESVDQEKKSLEDEEPHNGQQREVDARETYSRSSSDGSFVDKRRRSESIVKSEPSPSNAELAGSEASRDSIESASRTSPVTNPLDSLAALSSGKGDEMPQHTGSMLDHQLAALSRARAGRLTVCEICEKPFSCQSALEIHLRTHTKERPFMCKICQRAFTTKGNLKQHLLTHNITDIPEQMLLPVSSPKNDNSASTTPSSSPTPNESLNSLNLKRPTDSTDQSEPSAKRTFPRHWCHICQKQFSSASSLQIHNRTHTGEKPFACNVCGRAFTTKGNLKVHMGTHVWGAGGSRRGRRISMDNPLISPWMKNMTRPRPPQPTMSLPTSGPMADPAALYQQYAALASGLLTAKQDAASRFMLPMANGQAANSSSSPVSSNGSPHPPNEMGSPQNRVNGGNISNQAVSAATEWFLKAYQRTQEQVN